MPTLQSGLSCFPGPWTGHKTFSYKKVFRLLLKAIEGQVCLVVCRQELVSLCRSGASRRLVRQALKVIGEYEAEGDGMPTTFNIAAGEARQGRQPLD